MVSFHLAGSGSCRTGSNIWVGADVWCFVVAWSQFPLIRAFHSTSANRASGNGGNPRNLERLAKTTPSENHRTYGKADFGGQTGGKMRERLRVRGPTDKSSCGPAAKPSRSQIPPWKTCAGAARLHRRGTRLPNVSFVCPLASSLKSLRDEIREESRPSPSRSLHGLNPSTLRVVGAIRDRF
jgi:hypothetical protein